jgi:hypothetical protein
MIFLVVARKNKIKCEEKNKRTEQNTMHDNKRKRWEMNVKQAKYDDDDDDDDDDDERLL